MENATPRREITRLLDAWQAGEADAGERLFPLIYDHLKVLARRQLARGSSDTLGTTAVVHEAFVKLVDGAGGRFADRGHFYAVASRAMRQILVDYSRRRSARKRGGDRVRVDLDEERIPIEDRAAEILVVDEALNRLERLDPRLVRIVEMRFFTGLSVEETAEAIEASPSTVKREWKKARAFLYRELAADRPASTP
jgi:RNA polymerase sigma factor (TIGR02999 family)